MEAGAVPALYVVLARSAPCLRSEQKAVDRHGEWHDRSYPPAGRAMSVRCIDV